MSGIIGSKLNIRGSGRIAKLGTDGQVLTSSGAGVAANYEDAAGGGLDWQAVETGATFTAVAGNGYPVNTTAQACTVTLPASASVGDEIIFTDYARKWGTNALTINPNSLNYQGNTSPNPVYDTTGESIHIVYLDATKGWTPTYDGAVVLETPQTYTADWVVIAGGGAAGNTHGGGGGGGGYRSSYDSEASGAGSAAEPNITLSGGTVYTVTVGAGGGNPGSGSPVEINGSPGSDSSLSGTGLTTITSVGGGGGQKGTGGDPGQSGGCGGGSQGSGTGGAGTADQGEDGGGNTSGNGYGGAAGGGATVQPPNHTGGYTPAGQSGMDGGNGQTSTIIGSSTVYAGGGGGNGYWWASRGVGGGAGTGGGGKGGDTHNPAQGPAAPNEPEPGTANRGGGGGGGFESGTGGSGVVILRVGDDDYSGSTTGSPTVATDVGGSGDTVITFTAPGTYTG